MNRLLDGALHGTEAEAVVFFVVARGRQVVSE